MILKTDLETRIQVRDIFRKCKKQPTNKKQNKGDMGNTRGDGALYRIPFKWDPVGYLNDCLLLDHEQ